MHMLCMCPRYASWMMVIVVLCYEGAMCGECCMKNGLCSIWLFTVLWSGVVVLWAAILWQEFMVGCVQSLFASVLRKLL